MKICRQTDPPSNLIACVTRKHDEEGPVKFRQQLFHTNITADIQQNLYKT